MADFNSMTEYAEELAKRFEKLADKKGPYFLAASTIHAEKEVRIFDKGLDSNGAAIASSYTNEYLKFKQKNFPGSERGVVNLMLSSQLRSDWSASLQLDKGEWVEGVRNPADSDKIEGLEGKIYGKNIFASTPQERARYTDILRKERKKIGI